LGRWDGLVVKDGGVSTRVEVWPLHDIAIANIVGCIAYTRWVGGGAYIAKWACNSIAIGYGLQVGGGNKRMTDSYNKALK